MIPGREVRATEALAWVGERLFSAGLNGEIVEYDLDNHKVKYTLDAYGGPIWAIASNKQGTHLAVSLTLVLIILMPLDVIYASQNKDDHNPGKDVLFNSCC